MVNVWGGECLGGERLTIVKCEWSGINFVFLYILKEREKLHKKKGKRKNLNKNTPTDKPAPEGSHV